VSDVSRTTGIYNDDGSIKPATSRTGGIFLLKSESLSNKREGSLVKIGMKVLILNRALIESKQMKRRIKALKRSNKKSGNDNDNEDSDY